MKRKIYSQLRIWKINRNRKPLILLGARQVGKTWIIKDFGQREYEKVVYINCDDEPRMKDLFALDYNIDRIMLGLQAISGIKVEADNTLIILDEIQEVPRGLHSLKYFCENAPQLHVIAAGSLLGVTLGSGESFPIGKVDMLTEQFVMQQFTSMAIKPYYWSSDKTPAEIDFIIQCDGRVLPIEVKAEENVRSRSLAQYIKDNPGLKGLRISMRGYVDQGWMENIPLCAMTSYFNTK